MRNYADVDMENRRKKFGEQARWAREAVGYSGRPAFARDAGISERSVAAVERGEQSGRKTRAAFARAVGWDPADVEAFIEGRLDNLPTPEPSRATFPRLRDPREIFDLTALDDLNEILTVPRETLIKISRMVERVSGSAAAEKFLLNALELRRQHADQRRDISPSEPTNRDVS